MEIIWDEPKRIANIEKHGLDFADLSLEFFLASLVVPAKNGRSKAIGRLEDGTIVVIFVTLGSEALSVISMRPARKDERSLL
ncbi:BrnT family toxin [Sinorhizobium meliloti]|uniref:BrnT family toxin n=1 Tax=Rhizobium meliloti TaxID=382 RepID=UPI00040ED9A0|nr:BrnT family toxin [Sinorhizobium meliloti]UDU18829.1 BrnT family toxin [Sinorhizobium meliloti]